MKQRFTMPIEVVAIPFKKAVGELMMVKAANEYAINGYMPAGLINMNGYVIQQFVNPEILEQAAEDYANKIEENQNNNNNENPKNLGEGEIIEPTPNDQALENMEREAKEKNASLNDEE